MFRTLIMPFFSIIFLSTETLGQVPFAQVGQMPLLLNSSLAGSSGKHRISLGWNNLFSESQKISNYAASYDQVLKKWGSGIGAYYLFQQNKNGLVAEISRPNFGANTFEGNYLNNNSFHQAGICFAPKFNVMRASNPREIKCTFSPSLFFDFQSENKKTNQTFYQTEFHSTLYSIDFPSGKQSMDSIWDSKLSFTDKTQQYSSGIGLLLNTKNLILMSQSKLTASTTHETIQLSSYYQGKQTANSNEINIKQTLYSFDQNMNVGRSFRKSEESKFSFTPFAGIGFRHYLNLGTKTDDTTGRAVYSYNLSSKKRTDWNYFHFSANFKYSKLLFGTTVTRSQNLTFGGGTLGFQNDWMKLMGNISAIFEGKNVLFPKTEITVGLSL